MSSRFDGVFNLDSEDIASISRAVQKSLAKMAEATNKLREEVAVVRRNNWTPEQNDRFLRAHRNFQQGMAQRHLASEVRRVRKELGLPCA